MFEACSLVAVPCYPEEGAEPHIHIVSLIDAEGNGHRVKVQQIATYKKREYAQFEVSQAPVDNQNLVRIIVQEMHGDQTDEFTTMLVRQTVVRDWKTVERSRLHSSKAA